MSSKHRTIHRIPNHPGTHIIAMLALCLCNAGIAATASGLQWKSDTVHIHPDPHDSTCSDAFHFQNDGEKAVKIIKIRTPCGCTAAEPTQREYASGEKGKIHFRLNFSRGEGVFSKHIFVTSKIANERTTKKLTITVHATPYAELRPRSVSWTKGDEPSTKEVVFDVKRERKIHITDISIDSKRFRVRKESIDPGTKVRLHITPRSTDSKESAHIKITTDFPSRDNPLVYSVNTSILPDVPPPRGQNVFTKLLFTMPLWFWYIGIGALFVIIATGVILFCFKIL